MIKSHYLQSAFKRCCLTLLFLATFNIKSFGGVFIIDNLGYEILSLEDKTCMVTGSLCSGAVIIPDKIKYNDTDVSVVKIKDEAFDFPSITSLTIPASIVDTGTWTCYQNEHLRKVVFQEGFNEQPTVIGDYAFYDCRNLETVILSSNIGSIGQYAFGNCDELSSINLGVTSVSEIGENAFSFCTKLEGIVLPPSLQTIKDWAFYRTAITEVVGGESVTTIGKGVFAACEYLKDIKWEWHRKVIPEYTYSGCSSLTDIIIPSTIEEIKSGAFCGIDMNSFKLEDCEQPVKFSTTENVIANNGIHHIYLGRPIICDKNQKKPCLAIGNKGILELSKNIRELSSEAVGPYENLSILISHNLTPPTIPEMTIDAYAGLKVRVPAEALEAYKQAPVWKNFWNIKAIEDESGISDIECDDDDSFQVYDTAGILVDASCTSEKLQQLPHGVYIVVKHDKRMKIKI